MKRCPICHGRLTADFGNTTTVCCRCGCDLNLLLILERKAHALLSKAYYHYLNADKQQALVCIEHSLFLSKRSLAKLMYLFVTHITDRPTSWKDELSGNSEGSSQNLN